MTEAEARMAWMKETKTKISIFDHKTRKHKDVEVVPVEISRTRHQEQMAAEKHVSTVVLETQTNATEQSIKNAATRVLANLSESYEDDMFLVPWIELVLINFWDAVSDFTISFYFLDITVEPSPGPIA